MGGVTMPSQAAMKAVRDLQGLSALSDEGAEDYATIIDAHFAPYLAAVTALRHNAVLFKAVVDFMNDNPLAREFTTIYHDAECDGGCLQDDCSAAYDEVAQALAAIDRLEGK